MPFGGRNRKNLRAKRSLRARRERTAKPRLRAHSHTRRLTVVASCWCGCFGCCSQRAFSTTAMNLAHTTAAQLLKRAPATCSAYPHDALTILSRRVVRGSAPSAAERRLMVTPITFQIRQKCTSSSPSAHAQRRRPVQKRCAIPRKPQWHSLRRNWMTQWAVRRKRVVCH